MFRVVIEAGICVDYYIAEQLSNSIDLFIRIDESSKNSGRSFVEIEFDGKNKISNKIWNYCVALIEVENHTAQKLLNEILKSIIFF